jgi:4-amino-4-deoxy-L-arabinose transferase-like glycosyltransferase
MSSPGRPQGEIRRAPHEVAPVSAGLSPSQQRRWVLWWALGMAVLALLRIGAAPLFDVDEGAFSEATRELLSSGDWGHTTLNGEPRFDKPILIYWLQAASVSVFGLGEFALRLPSALATWGWALAAVLLVWPRWGLAAALAAGTVLGSSLGVLLIGRAATADAVLNLWLALAAMDLWRHLEAPVGSLAARAPLRRAALWIALGVLTKGPVAIIVPGAAVLLWVLLGTPRTAWWGRLRGLLGDVPAWALLLGVALPWYAYALHRHGMAFVDGFFVRHNLQRYGGTLEGHGGSVGYYVVMLPLLLLPWSALLVPVLARVRRLWAEPLARFLLLWAGFVLVFFSLSGTKLPHYALYGITPLALLAGRALAELHADPARRGLKLALLACLMAVPLALVGASAVAVHLAPTVKDVLYQALLSQPAVLTGMWGLAGASALLSLVLLWPARRTASPGVEPGLLEAGSSPMPALQVQACAHAQAMTPLSAGLARTALAGACAAAVLVGGLAPWWGQLLQGPVRTAALVARRALGEAGVPAQATVVQWALHLPSLAVYAQREAPRRAPRPGDLALVRTDQLPRLSAELARAQAPSAAGDVQPRYDLLYSAGGLSLIRWQAPAPVTSGVTALQPAAAAASAP